MGIAYETYGQVMTWFTHRHWWRRMTGKVELFDSRDSNARASGIMIIEDCRCGAVRTIEIVQGCDPVVRVALKTAVGE